MPSDGEITLAHHSIACHRHAMRLIVCLILASLHLSFADQSYLVKKDLLYRKDDSTLSEYQRERCRLDLSYPTDSSNFSTIVWFHGGGLTSGNKNFPKGLQNKGHAIVAVNYRLSPRVKVAGHQDGALMELDGYGHQMTEPAHPLLLNFVKRISQFRQFPQKDKK